jgi:hypothetical protein
MRFCHCSAPALAFERIGFPHRSPLADCTGLVPRLGDVSSWSDLLRHVPVGTLHEVKLPSKGVQILEGAMARRDRICKSALAPWPEVPNYDSAETSYSISAIMATPRTPAAGE